MQNKLTYTALILAGVVVNQISIAQTDAQSEVERVISKAEFVKLYPLTDGATLQASYKKAYAEYISANEELSKAQTSCEADGSYEKRGDWSGQEKCIARVAPNASTKIAALNHLTGLLQNCPAVTVTGNNGERVDFSGAKPDPAVIKTITTKYTYENLVASAQGFPGFLSSSDVNINKHELAAFLANTNQETLGFCFDSETPFYILEKINTLAEVKAYGPRMLDWLSREDKAELRNLNPSLDVSGQTWASLGASKQEQLSEWFFRVKKPRGKYCGSSNCSGYSEYYYGRGALQLSYPENYRAASTAINSTHVFAGAVDLYNNPNEVVDTKYNTAHGSSLLWSTALWFWMTPQGNKPSAHQVMSGGWTPNTADKQNGRKPGFGSTINIINGGLECGVAITRAGSDSDAKEKEQNRIDTYKGLLSALGAAADNETTHPTTCEEANDFRCDSENVGKVDYCPIRDGSIKPGDDVNIDCEKKPDIGYTKLAQNICKKNTNKSSGDAEFDKCYNDILAWNNIKACDPVWSKQPAYDNCMQEQVYKNYCSK
jgi:hypothetical protein